MKNNKVTNKAYSQRDLYFVDNYKARKFCNVNSESIYINSKDDTVDIVSTSNYELIKQIKFDGNAFRTAI